MRATRSIPLAPLLLAALVSGMATVGCGGSDKGHPPSISGLYLSSPAAVDGAGNASVLGSLSFSDSGGDVAFLTISSELATSTIPISGAGGVTSGSGSATVTVAPGRYGTIRFEVWLVDRAGAESNRLPGAVTFVPDDSGRAWTQVSTLRAAALAQATGANHARYVAVGAGGLIATSEDGSEWTQQPSPVTADLNGVAWSGWRFVAVGDDATVVSSEDGYSWTIEAVPVAGGHLYAVSWGGGAFVAVGGGPRGPEMVALRSTDGASWTQGTGLEVHSATPSPLLDAAWGCGRWVAIEQWRWVSTDGVSWSRAPGDYSERISLAVGWNGARFVSVGFVDVGLSADGLTWILATYPPHAFPIGGLAWSGHHWLALGQGYAWTSTDGNEWSGIALNPTSFGSAEVIWDGERYPARYLAANGLGIWTSP